MQKEAIAAFASRHPAFAAGLIIFSELTNAVIGLLLGSALLADKPGWFLTWLLVVLIILRTAFCRFFATQLPDLVSRSRFWFQKNSYTLLFTVNLLAYTVAGGISGRSILHPEPSVSIASEGYRAYSETSRKDTLTTPAKSIDSTDSPADEKPQPGTRFGYVMLFLVGVFLSFGASALACRLACTNQGILAVFVVLLGLGIMAGGIYFLGRALTPNMKRYKDMTKNERKREGRRYFRILLATVGITLVSFLLGTIL